MIRLRPLATLVAALLLAPLAFAQSYTSVLVFGDSLSDTGNVAHLTESQDSTRIPSPLFGYTDGRFTDGTDTLPAAHNFSGVWIEQLAASLAANPPVTNSLDGGTNYAYGFAYTGTGTSVLSFPSPITFSVNVDNIGQQVTDYLTAHPTVPAGTLVAVWGGANDIINATSAADIATAVTNEVTAIQRLIAAGATDILVVNLPPIGAVPRFNGSTSTSGPFDMASAAFNTGLAAALNALPASPTLHLFQLDINTLFNTVIASPADYSLSNVTAKSQLDLTVNPDTYFFWDDLHPTTEVHHLIAQAALKLITPVVAPGITAALTSSALTVSSGSATSDTVTVTPAGGYGGTVAVACGTLPAAATNLTCAVGLGSVNLSFAGTAAPQTATVTLRTDGVVTAVALRPASTTAAFLLLPLAGLGGLFARRRRHPHPGLLLAVLVLSAGGLLGLSGCGGNGKNNAPTTTPAGTYTIPVTVTPSIGAASTLNLTLIVQ